MASGSVAGFSETQRTYPSLKFWTLFLAGFSVLDLLLALVLVVAHAASPASVTEADLAPFVYVLAACSSASVTLGVVWLFLRYPQHRRVMLVLLAITLGVMVAHLYTISEPPTSQCTGNNGVQGCVMDEIYYVPAAQAMLSGEKCGPYLDNCNLEHPFLSKAFIAAGIALFGNNDFGWRFFEGLLGTACVPILFAICLKFTRDTFLSLIASFLLAFETLFFIQSSIAVIDVHMIFFGLLAFLAYLADIHIWKLDRYIISGALLGLSVLSKEMGVFMAAFLVTYALFFGQGGSKVRTLSAVKMAAVALLVFCGGLQVYDSLFGNAAASTFIADIHYILSYGSGLKGSGWSIFANGQAPYITPFTWFLYYLPVAYDVIRVTVTSSTQSYTYVSVGYFGAPDLFETWFVYLWIPYVLYVSYKDWRVRRRAQQWDADLAKAEPPPPDVSTPGPVSSALRSLVGKLFRDRRFDGSDGAPPSEASDSTGGVQLTLEGTPAITPESEETSAFELAKFAVLLFAFTVVPYFVLFFYGRVTYPYYILSADPAMAIGMAYVITRRWFPREVTYILLAGVFAWFFIFYPDKNFLPVWIRAWLGH